MRARMCCALLALAVASGACTYGESVDPPEDIKTFNPTRALPAVQAYAGEDARLLGFDAFHVRSDGTMDLSADYRPWLRYKFIRKRVPKKSDGPIGTGSGGKYEQVEVEVREPHWVHITTHGGGGNKETTEKHKGMNRTFSSASDSDWDKSIKAPKCGTAEVWKAARKAADIPKGAVATITWARGGYEFRISDIKVDLYFDEKCRPLTRDEYYERERAEPSKVDEARERQKALKEEGNKRRKEAEERRARKLKERETEKARKQAAEP